jgi:hypothetical protein
LWSTSALAEIPQRPDGDLQVFRNFRFGEDFRDFLRLNFLCFFLAHRNSFVNPNLQPMFGEGLPCFVTRKAGGPSQYLLGLLGCLPCACKIA